MTSNGTPNPASRSPGDAMSEAEAVLSAVEAAGLTVDEALDAIELAPGDPRLSPLLARLGEHPSLVARLSALRADRALLASAAEVRPISVRNGAMLESAIERARVEAEREALLSLERGTEFDTPPVSRIIPIRRRWYDRVRYQMTTSPTTVWFGAAAAILLVVSGAATLLADRLGFLIHAPQRMAETPAAAPAPVERVDAASPVAPVAVAAAAEPVVAMPGGLGFASLSGLEEASASLGSRRLVIVARGDAASLAGLRRHDRLWRIEGSAPRVTTASLPMAEFAAWASPQRTAHPSRAFAGEVDDAPSAAPDTPRAAPGAPAVSVTLARVSVGRAPLASLAAQLERVGFDVSFVELETAVAAPSDLSPEAVGWWGRPPTAWPDRAPVPIIIAPRD